MTGKNKRVTIDAPQDKAELLRELRELVGGLKKDFQTDSLSMDEILKESRAKQDEILEFINTQLRESISEKINLEQQLEKLREELESSIRRESMAEEKAEALAIEREEALRKAEGALNDKTQTEAEKLELEQTIESLSEALESSLKREAEAEEMIEKAGREQRAAQQKAEDAMDRIAWTEAKTGEALKDQAETERQLKIVSNEKTIAEEALAELKLQYVQETGELTSRTQSLEAEAEDAAGIAEIMQREKKALEAQIVLAVKEKVSAEEKLENAESRNETLYKQVLNLEADLKESISLAEVLSEGKKQAEEKLLELQESWERYIKS